MESSWVFNTVIVTVIVICGIGLIGGQRSPLIDSVCQAVQRQQLECQVHRVETADGYRLSLHRIPAPRSPRCPQHLRPFVLMHGLLGSAGDFVSGGRGRSLALELHARCFDVWLGNARGTTHSRGHRTLATSDARFWQFSWHEIGVYDLPAIVDYVLARTNRRQVHYVGHSQGTTVLLVLLSQRPEYNVRFANAALMAPVAFLQHLSSPPLRLLASDSVGVTLLLNKLGLHELLPATALTQVGGQFFCTATRPTYALCTLFTSLYVGFSDYPLDRNILPRILENTPAGISRGQLQHFGQLINSGKFQQYDHRSPRLNTLRYGQATPPSYQLANVRLQLQIFHGNRDALSSQADVQRLVRELRNSNSQMYQVPGYNHIDFLFASSATQMVYERIIQQAWQLDAAALQGS
ncbi:lipase 3 [Drosophila takahashii]|uniref:lipase 3 n=1 Tax=Drosophila takahashii TaxID=29030 RepID=UPI001CF88C6F|nr:lipase 3 [Drosophila takahashii]